MKAIRIPRATQTPSLLAAALLGIFFLTAAFPAQAEESAFNRLVLQKQFLEKTYGIARLECFPFMEKFGDREGETRRILECLKGVLTLTAALKEVPDADLNRVAISTRFLRTGGFHTVLIPWDAEVADLARILRERLSPADQQAFLEKIAAVKTTIHGKLFIRELYCSLTITNDQCLRGYETLAKVEPDPALRRKMWAEVTITDSETAKENPEILPLRYDADVERMTQQLRADTTWNEWEIQKKAYETIQERFGDTFKKLQLPTFYCDVSLSPQECIQGAENFHKAAQTEVLQSKTWGRVRVTRYNTRIQSDYNVAFRYDMAPEEIVKVFAAKPEKREIEKAVTRAEKLEGLTKNNATGLRAVCDLVDLASALCVQGFEYFIDFVRAHPDFRPAGTATDVMFVDGTQVSRLNFALNSNSRAHYIYVDVRSPYPEFEAHLLKFGKDSPAPVR
ncbi:MULTISPECIES: hypothetical protein [unclassified Nitrospina]|uniref:hypothetical protein n=1 Tax=unclassified Nitrospina TaxID=2638683 RepID=UPI003F965410